MNIKKKLNTHLQDAKWHNSTDDTGSGMGRVEVVGQ